MDLFLNTDERKLKQESLTYAIQRQHSPEVEREHAMNLRDADIQSSASDESDFDKFHSARSAQRAATVFLAAHPEYIDSGSNKAQILEWISFNGMSTSQPEAFEQAFDELSAAGRLELDTTKKSKRRPTVDLDGLNQEQLLDLQHAAEEKEAKERARDMEEFVKGGIRTAYKFLRLRPDYIPNAYNVNQMNSMLSSWRIDINNPTLAELEAVYRQLVSEQKLQLRTVSASEPSETDLYSWDMTKLAEAAGGREKTGPKEYVPSGLSQSFGSVGFTFEPGEEQ